MLKLCIVFAFFMTAAVQAEPVFEPVEFLVVPPYLEVAVFDLFRGSPDARVELFPPGSRTPLRGGIDGVEALGIGHVMSTFVVPRPKPGLWLIRKSRPDARVRILSQQFFPRGMLVQPAPDAAPRQHDSLSLVYRLLDSSGSPLTELPGYPLSLDLSLVRPDGAIDSMIMERAHPAEFRSRREAELPLAGRYWVDGRVTTVDVHSRRLEVFRDRWSQFTALPAHSSAVISRDPPPMASRWLLLAVVVVAAIAAVVMRRRLGKSL